MPIMRLTPYILAILACAPLSAAAATADIDTDADTTARALREVVVTATRPPVEVIPVQRLGGEELKRLNSQSVADALRYF